jgi:hypothetical protein
MSKGCMYINYRYYQHVWVTCMYTLNHIGGVMIGVLASFVVNHGFGPRSSHTIIKLVFAAFFLGLQFRFPCETKINFVDI